MQTRSLAPWLAPLLVSACIPYTVATTAAPIPVGEMRNSTVMFVTPLVDGRENETPPQWAPGLDHEMRFGIDGRSDFGIRVTSFSGLVFNYKRLLSDSSSRMLVAVMPRRLQRTTTPQSAALTPNSCGRCAVLR